jgi:hypothetical protein
LRQCKTPLKIERKSLKRFREPLKDKHHETRQAKRHDKGSFVGAFNPTSLSTDACEDAVKHDAAGDKKVHRHKVAAEITLIVVVKTPSALTQKFGV